MSRGIHGSDHARVLRRFWKFGIGVWMAALVAAAVPQAMAQEKGAGMFSPVKLRESLAASPNPLQVDAMRRGVMRAFGQDNLLRGRAGARVEQTTVAWAIIASEPAVVVGEDGKLLGEMTALGADGLQVLALEMPNFSEIHYRIEVGGRTQLGGQVRVEHFEHSADSLRQPGVPEGSLETFEWAESKVFPDTMRQVTVYLPAGYKRGRPVCLMVWQDGSRHVDPNGPMRASVVFDNLIHQGDMPATIGVFIDPGRRANQAPGERPASRGFEYDSLGDAYSRFLLEEILPEVTRRFGATFIERPEAWAIAGGSSGGICAFTVAWERPDKFHKVLSWVGSFVNLRGGHVYPSLIRLTEPKAIRVYLLGGENDLDNPYGNWPLANQMMARALEYQGYDVRLDWTQCFHGVKGMAPALPDALRWLWRDWKNTVGIAARP